MSRTRAYDSRMEPLLAAGGIAACVALVLALERRGSRWELLPKGGASALFVWLGLSRLDPADPVGRAMVVALVLCALGDLLLVEDRTFDAGLAAFLAGHLAFVVAFHRASPLRDWPVLAVAPVAAVAAIVLRQLWPRLGSRRLPVLAYAAAITAMVWGAIGAAASGARSGLVVWGAVLFFVSDLFVARQRFGTPARVNRVVGLPLYYLGVLLLASCVAPGG